MAKSVRYAVLEPQRQAELRRGATLGLLRLRIEAMRLRLELETLCKAPAVDLFAPPEAEPAEEGDTPIVPFDPARRRVFQLSTGQATLLPAAGPGTEALRAVARELLDVLDAELASAVATA
jgi:hypothetical protein